MYFLATLTILVVGMAVLWGSAPATAPLAPSLVEVRRPFAWLRHWYLTLLLPPIYLGVFLIWKLYPSRACFTYGTVISLTLMGAAMAVAWRRRYFVNRLDLVLHAIVLLDVLAEGLFYEVSRGFLGASPEVERLVQILHDNHNFWGCGLAFTVIPGGYRAYSMRRARQQSEMARQ